MCFAVTSLLSRKYKMERGEIKVEFIPLIEIVANSMSNGLSSNKFIEHVAAMGLTNT